MTYTPYLETDKVPLENSMPIGACQVSGVCFSGNGPERHSDAARESDVACQLLYAFLFFFPISNSNEFGIAGVGAVPNASQIYQKYH
jgi:hypothetical protein